MEKIFPATAAVSLGGHTAPHDAALLALLAPLAAAEAGGTVLGGRGASGASGVSGSSAGLSAEQLRTQRSQLVFGAHLHNARVEKLRGHISGSVAVRTAPVVERKASKI